jgi:hypothetical protein
MLPGYVDFLNDTKKAFKADKVVHIGDLVNWNSISYHEVDPNTRGPREEYNEALVQVNQLYKAFPKCTWFIGNHDCLPNRKNATAGIPDVVLRGYTDLWEVPKWEVVPRKQSRIIDNVLYRHGDKGKGGMYAAVKNAKEEFFNLVQGHQHQEAGVWFHANERPTDYGGLIFGMNVGCGMDHTRAEMEYGQSFNRKPIISCGIVEDGFYPSLIPMRLSEYGD